MALLCSYINRTLDELFRTVAFQIGVTNVITPTAAVLVSGSYTDPTWLVSIPYTKITGIPILPVALSEFSNDLSGFPQLTTVARNAIPAPAEGRTIYNLTTHTIDFFDGTVWKSVLTS